MTFVTLCGFPPRWTPCHLAIGSEDDQLSGAVPRSVSLAASSASQSATSPVLDLSGTADPQVSVCAVDIGVDVGVAGAGVAAGGEAWQMG